MSVNIFPKDVLLVIVNSERFSALVSEVTSMNITSGNISRSHISWGNIHTTPIIRCCAVDNFIFILG